MEGANAVEVAKSVRGLLPLISSELPGSVRLMPIYDRSQTIVNSVKDVRETLLIAFVLVVFVIFIFLGGSAPQVVGLLEWALAVATFVWMLGATRSAAHAAETVHC